jgi:hypothetical protein
MSLRHGRHLKAARVLTGMTQRQLAHAAGLDVNSSSTTSSGGAGYFGEFARAHSRGKAIFPMIVSQDGDQFIGDDLQGSLPAHSRAWAVDVRKERAGLAPTFNSQPARLLRARRPKGEGLGSRQPDQRSRGRRSRTGHTAGAGRRDGRKPPANHQEFASGWLPYARRDRRWVEWPRCPHGPRQKLACVERAERAASRECSAIAFIGGKSFAQRPSILGRGAPMTDRPGERFRSTLRRTSPRKDAGTLPRQSRDRRTHPRLPSRQRDSEV